MVVTFAQVASAITLTLIAVAAAASDGGEPRYPLYAGIRDAREHAGSLDFLVGYEPPVGKCADLELGPLPSAEYTGPEAWQTMLQPRCPVRWLPTDKRWNAVADLCTEAGDAGKDRRTRKRLGRKIKNLPLACGLLGLFYLEQQHKKQECSKASCNQRFFLNIPAGRLTDAFTAFSIQTGCQITSNLGDLKAQEPMATAIVGTYKTKQALQNLLTGTNLVQNWVDCEVVHVYPRNLPYGEGGVTDMLVTGTRLGSLQGSAPKVVVLDRQHIDRTGASSIPELLQHSAQTAFTRGRGYRPSGAQYAELRGIGAEFTKVLINGRPTFGTATDMAEGAFDLNVVPLAAVERIEITLDAVSLAHGADAIGGTVNIVLREASDQIAEARYESANDGATMYRGSILAGLQSDTSSASIIMDYTRTTPLFGASRGRWRNEDWTRYGGADHRSTFGAPPNVRSLDGAALPGMSSSFAAVDATDSGALPFREGEQNLTSLLAWLSIVPESRQMSISAVAHHDTALASLSAELLVAQRQTLLQFGPEVIAGLPMGAEHPQNSFGGPVAVSAALTGLPSLQHEYDSTLVRAAFAASGKIGSNASYETHVLHMSDVADATWLHQIDPAKVIEALSGHGTHPLNIFTDAPGEGRGTGLFLPRRTDRRVNGATEISARVRGGLWHLPAGMVAGSIGIEGRREFARFEPQIDRVERDVASGYASLEAPLVDGLTATYGVRRDDYEGLSPVVSHQYILRWRPTVSLRFHASYSDAYDPPDFWDLKFPSTTIRGIPIFDATRDEVAAVTIVTGGNEELRPTTGRTTSIGFRWGAEDSFWTTMSLWHVELADRNALVPPLTLLANEGIAISGRIGREHPTAEDIAVGRPGRLSSLDITRANFGSTTVQGVDLTVASTWETSFGIIRPRLDVSHTDEFRFADLPTTDSLERDRTGIASQLGTITGWRLRGSVGYTHGSWSVNLLARYNSCYQDFISAQGQSTDRTVCPGLGLDANATKELSEHIRLTLGVSDVYNSSVPFSEVSGFGFDPSQRDITGPTGYVGLTVAL